MEKKGAVYLFRHFGTNHVKIGMTQDETVESRFLNFKTYAATGAELVGIILSNNPRQLEQTIHKEYSHRRMSGEFFNLTNEECLIILKRYETDREKNLRELFETWISNPSNNIDGLISYMKESNRKINEIEESQEDKIFRLCESYFLNSMISSQDLVEFLKPKGVDLTKHMLGKILRKRYKLGQYRVKGQVKKLYTIKIPTS